MCSSSRSRPIEYGGFYSETILASGSYFRAMIVLNPILLSLQMGYRDGLMTNQLMITHYCGVIHLEFFNFFGGTDITQQWL